MSYLKAKLNKRVLVDVRLTPDDWDLYTSEPEVERVAEYLNERFNEFVNAGWDRTLVRKSMDKHMRLYSAWGANDTEPHRVLEQLLEEVYG